LSQSGRLVEAAAAMQRTRELEPLEAISFALSSQVAYQGRENQSAREFARRAIALDASFWIGHLELGQAYAQMGETALALEALKDAARFSGGNSKALSLRGYVLARAGRVDEAREVFRRLEYEATTRYVPPYAFALVLAGLDDRAETFAWLERAYDERDVHLIFLVSDPKWDAYRADPRFERLVARCQFVTGARL
jgi:tetratricopeptide (TPR) repeat protein